MQEMGRKISAGFLCKGLLVAGLLLGLFGSISLATETTTYYIRAGDTLNSVAAAHDITLTELLDLNPEITDPNRVYVGTAIQVPTPEEDGSAVAQCPQPYVVVARDTWASIAMEHGVEADILALVNSMTVTDNLAVGTEICIPVTPTPMPTARGEVVHMDILEVLVVSPHLQGITYDRDDWQHWTDADGDCQNARAEVLIEESRAPVTFRANNPCIVHSGLWTGPWGREQFVLASDLDIDHHVPLFNAHLSGGATWSAGKKRAYANDLSLAAALQATKASYNRQKGGRGPEEWKPPLRETWCTYAQGWIDVKYKYSLTVTVPEKAALQDMLSTCDGSTPATAVHPVAPTPPSSVAPTPPSSLPAPGAGEGFWYTIGRGDSLGRIASRHDCPLHVLVAVNQISNPSIIRLGDRLWIPTHCAVLDARASAWAPPPTATPALPLPTSTPTRTPVPAQPPASTPTPVPPTPVPPAPTATQVPVPPTPTYTPVPLPVSQTGYQCTVNPYNPPPQPQNRYRACTQFKTRAEFDQYYGGSFYRSHDRDRDCIPCESLN